MRLQKRLFTRARYLYKTPQTPDHTGGQPEGTEALWVDGRRLAVTDRLGDECLALRMSSELNDEAVDRICVARERVMR